MNGGRGGSLTGSVDEQTVTIALDAEGGDRAPGEVVAGALQAASPALHVLLVGRPDELEPYLQGAGDANIEVVQSGEVITSDEDPARAVRNKVDASIVVGARAVAEGRAEGFVSAGSTGAMLAAGLLVVRRVKGVSRPAIVTVLPGLNGPLVFLDAGANSDCRPEHLVEFGVLGSVFAREMLGIKSPRVALLNIGEEPTKGDSLTKEAHRLMRVALPQFTGNVEGRELFYDSADVIVTDGFTGNVTLKVLEGTAASLFQRVKHASVRDTRSKVGGFLLKPALVSLRDSLDPEEYGGTYLLGVRGLMVICHGSSTRRAIKNALEFAAAAARQKVVGRVEEEIARINGSGV